MKITLDQLFKQFGLRYFTAKNCEVRPEDELYAAPKRIDLLVVKKEPKESWNKLGILDYFLEYNLISYKSFRDNVSLKDLWDCFIYYHACLRKYPEATQENTTITLIVSKIPKSFFRYYGSSLKKTAKGEYEIKNEIIYLKIINIEEAELRGESGAFLSIFYKDKARIKKEKKFTKRVKKMVDTFRSMVNFRLVYFEKEEPVGAIADITELVEPRIRAARAEGKAEGRLQTAKAMLAKEYTISEIAEITGIPQKEIKKYK